MFLPRRILIKSAFISCCLVILLVVATLGFLGGVPDRTFPSISGIYTRTYGYPEVVYVPDYTSGPYVTADSAILMESKTGTILYAKNEHVRRPQASTTKIMTAILALERGDLNSTVVVSRRAAGIEGSSLWLREGERIRLDDLLRGIMLRSANDGCVALAEHIAGSVEAFVDMMNIKARKLGAWNTSFRNPHGLHHPNHYSSAFDLALMARYGLKYPKFAEIVRRREDTIELTAKDRKEKLQLSNTNLLLWSFEGADGVKTGTTSAAGYCLVASATREGRQLIAVVLHSDSRWSDTARLLEYGFQEFSVVSVAKKGVPFIRTLVEQGMKPEVALIPERDVDVIVRKKHSHLLEERVVLERRPAAPIRKGEVLGRLAVFFDKDEIASADLLAAEGVPKRTWVRRILK